MAFADAVLTVTNLLLPCLFLFWVPIVFCGVGVRGSLGRSGYFVLLVSALSCSCSQPYEDFMVGLKGLGCPFLCAA